MLPWLSQIQEAGGLDASILTHSHMDHSGALPLLYSLFEGIPFYLTPPTLSIIRILLQDALKIMSLEAEREGEVPLYPAPAVERLLGAATPVPFLQPLSLFGGEIQLSFHPAGHILGAALVLLESRKDGVLVHGSHEARPALAQAVQKAGHEQVYLPDLGDSLSFAPRPPLPSPTPRNGP